MLLFIKVLLAEFWFAVAVGMFVGSHPNAAPLKHWWIAAIGAGLWLLGHLIVLKRPYSLLGILPIIGGLTAIAVALLNREILASTVLSSPYGLLTLASLLLLVYKPPES